MDGRLPFAWLELARKVLARILGALNPSLESTCFALNFRLIGGPICEIIRVLRISSAAD